jgi:hypothetical protein
VLTVHIPDEDDSAKRHAYPFCSLTEDVSEEERAEVANHFDVPAKIKSLRLTQ